MAAMIQDMAEDANRMVTDLRKRVNPMDTTSLLMVFGVTIAALILGALVWNGVIGRTSTHQDAAGLRLTYPGSWALSDAGAATGTTGDIVVSSPLRSGDVSTRFLVQRVLVDATAPTTTTLGLVANDLAATRGRALSSFRVLESEGFTGTGATKQPLMIKGLPGYRMEYVFVDTPTNALRSNIPSVIIGEDRLVLKGDTVYVFSLQSTEANRTTARQQFDNFVESAQLP